jgi:hypothetical protein
MFTLLLIAHFSFMRFPMPLRQVILLTVVLLQVIVFSLDHLSLPGNLRSKRPYLVLVLNPDFGHLLLPLLKLFGCVGSWLILVSLLTLLHLLCYNLSAIQIAHDPVKHELTKHIGVDASFIRSHCQQKTIDLQYVPSESQLADFFTKAQTRTQHQFHLIKLKDSDPPFPP